MLLRFSFIAVLFFSHPAFARQIQFMLGAQMESITEDEETISRSSLTSFYGEYMQSLRKKLYVAMGVGSTMSIAGFKLITFSVDGTLRYFLKGQGDDVSVKSEDVTFVSKDKWSYFVGLGFSQRFIETTAFGSLSRGGLKIENGIKVQLKDPYFYSVHLQYIMAGADAERGYNSIDAYVGFGYKF